MNLRFLNPLHVLIKCFQRSKEINYARLTPIIIVKNILYIGHRLDIKGRANDGIYTAREAGHPLWSVTLSLKRSMSPLSMRAFLLNAETLTSGVCLGGLELRQLA